MKNLPQLLNLANIVSMAILITLIALQNKSSGGLSTVFGGAGTVAQTRRGVEKWLFYTTIVFGVIFVGLSIAIIILRTRI